MSWSPSTTVGVRHGRHRASEMVVAYSETTGVATAAATWAAPVLPTTTTAADATAFVRARSPELPVTATDQPRSTSASTAALLASSPHARAGTEAPGCT